MRSTLQRIGLVPAAALTFVACGCALKLESVDSMHDVRPPSVAGPQNTDGASDLLYSFFNEDLPPGGYVYAYPPTAYVKVTESTAKVGEVSAEISLAANEWSGGAIAASGAKYDLSANLERGALEFWVRGEKGGEKAIVCLIDDKNEDSKATAVRVPLENLASIGTEWKKVQIPLADFGMKGAYWDDVRKCDVPHRFDWSRVCELKIECKKDENASFLIWIDDVVFRRDVFPARELMVLWEDQGDRVGAPPAGVPQGVKIGKTFIRDALPTGAAHYVYGGQTYAKFGNTGAKDNKGVLMLFLDNTDYSGVTINLMAANMLDLRKVRENNGGIGFWLKGAPGVGKLYLGLLDDASDGKKTHTKRYIQEFGKIDTTWRFFVIPLKEFDTRGFFWDDVNRYEGAGRIDWSRIEEIRFSSQRGENDVGKNKPVAVLVDEISIVERVPGYVHAGEFWTKFASSAGEKVLHEFSGTALSGWSTSSGAASSVKLEIVQAPAAKQGTGSSPAMALRADFVLKDWIDIKHSYLVNAVDAAMRDWTRHCGLALDIHSDEPYRGIMVQVSDNDGEVFYANTGARQGWNKLNVPFANFRKYDWQPKEAVEDGQLRLDKVSALTIKPKGGHSGSLYIGRVVLTNAKPVKDGLAREVATVISGNADSTLVREIRRGLFGINIQSRDPFMHDAASAKLVKDAGWSIVRFPGGLDADDYHWREVLEKGDSRVFDTDDYLEYLKKTGTEGMITVNYGTGTPAEAAEWVRYVNIEKKASIKYWEVGNEVNLPFHPNVTTADKYGERAAEYIGAMKAVDPSIKIGVIFGDREWNSTVYDLCGSLADAAVHHSYPMGPPDEEDEYMLEVPAVFRSWAESWKTEARELAANGGKELGIWLTEWNATWSTNERLTQWINGLFCADMLGQLAAIDLESAQFWALRNPIGPGFGDHGVVSRALGEKEGNNAPRPPYFGHKLAMEALSGKLAWSQSADSRVVSYLAVKGGKPRLMIINKYPESTVKAALNVKGLDGVATIRQITGESSRHGPTESRATVTRGYTITLPPYSLTLVRVE